jgi:hypothetical protein
MQGMKWFAVGLFLASSANSALIIDVGGHELLPDTPNQTVQVFVSGGDAVQGLNFYAQVADGGPAAGGTITGPSITAVNILSGTIFASNNAGQDDPGSLPQLAARTTTTASGTVSASGLLATLTFDTTGFTTTQSWALSLGDTLNGPTDFAGVPITITDGSISVIPEPESVAILGLVMSALLRRRASTLT